MPIGPYNTVLRQHTSLPADLAPQLEACKAWDHVQVKAKGGATDGAGVSINELQVMGPGRGYG